MASASPQLPPSFIEVVNAYPQVTDAAVPYGTAGFRTKGLLLPPLAARISLLMALRLADVHVARTRRHTSSGSTPSDTRIGCMITASHNPAEDNGFKIIDHDGGMLHRDWEPIATAMANARDPTELAAAVPSTLYGLLCNWEDYREALFKEGAMAVIGRDTRATGPDLEAAVSRGLASLGVPYLTVGLVTTPELHFHVWNHTDLTVLRASLGGGIPNHWADTIVASYKAFIDGHTNHSSSRMRWVSIDCANGVGALSVAKLHAAVDQHDANIRLCPANTLTDDAAALNFDCGADYTQRGKKLSVHHVSALKTLSNEALAVQPAPPTLNVYSVDGDADRVVSFVIAPEHQTLLDGDRFTVLFVTLLQRLVSDLEGIDPKPCIGVVQTPYANGGSTHYIRDTLGVEVTTTATGVKHLHPVAARYDIGLYFEANGHGTVLFGDGSHGSHDVVTQLREAAARGVSAARQLLCLRGILSQSCGDAFGNIFAAEAALQYLNWSVSDWLLCYADLPSRQIKIASSNPRAITTTPDETRAMTPAGLQESIDLVITERGDPAARAFVRPSGTEPIIRLYVEAGTEAQCIFLSDALTDIVRRYCP